MVNKAALEQVLIREFRISAVSCHFNQCFTFQVITGRHNRFLWGCSTKGIRFTRLLQPRRKQGRKYTHSVNIMKPYGPKRMQVKWSLKLSGLSEVWNSPPPLFFCKIQKHKNLWKFCKRFLDYFMRTDRWAVKVLPVFDKGPPRYVKKHMAEWGNKSTRF